MQSAPLVVMTLYQTTCHFYFSPIGNVAVSQEVTQAMGVASEAICKSRDIRQDAASAIDHTHRMQQAAHESVNESLIRKIAQTITLTVSQLVIGQGLSLA